MSKSCCYSTIEGKLRISKCVWPISLNDHKQIKPIYWKRAPAKLVQFFHSFSSCILNQSRSDIKTFLASNDHDWVTQSKDRSSIQSSQIMAPLSIRARPEAEASFREINVQADQFFVILLSHPKRIITLQSNSSQSTRTLLDSAEKPKSPPNSQAQLAFPGNLSKVSPAGRLIIACLSKRFWCSSTECFPPSKRSTGLLDRNINPDKFLMGSGKTTFPRTQSQSGQRLVDRFQKIDSSHRFR
jgi:hypothetical protein